MVPVVSQASHPAPFQTWPAMAPGSVKFPPLWPGSMPTIFPASGSGAGLGLAGLAVPAGAVAGLGADGGAAGCEAEDTAGPAGTVPDGAAGRAVPQPVPARPSPARLSTITARPGPRRGRPGRPGRRRSVINPSPSRDGKARGRPSRRG